MKNVYQKYEGNISIHTTLAGGDAWQVSAEKAWTCISIHTTLAGGDPIEFAIIRAGYDFNPHHPRGWRPHKELP